MARSNRFAGFLTLGKDVNKAQAEKELGEAEGIISDLTPELKLSTPDSELIELKKRWTKKWEANSSKLSKRRKDSEKYWLGKQKHGTIFDGDDSDIEHPLVDNIIFEALETFLPQATRRSPDPIVRADDTEEGEELASKTRKMLIYLSDILVLRLKIKSVVRNWALYFLGAVKVGWDFEENEISLTALRPQKFIMDPDASITEKGVYTGAYIGEFKKDTAEDLIARFPAKQEFISDFVQGKLGTEIQYVEWWAKYGKILFWTLKDEVLDKARNPHWNYPETRTTFDDFGNEVEEDIGDGELNHFKQPQFPYVFLSVFNLGIHPYDETSLIEQNLGQQDLITKRSRQIDTNVNGMNGGWAISGELSGIEKEQAGAAIAAFRTGQGVWIPQGSVDSAVKRMQGGGLPTDVFNQLQDSRNQLRNIFGVSGSSAEGTKQEETVRGKIIVAQQDQSRIGGGVGEYIEQFADRVYNQFVQFMYVYYTEDHMASIIGKANAFETIKLHRDNLDRKLLVSVKEGSLIPEDPLTRANQAIDLFTAGAIAPITLHERLDDPNPQETVEELTQFTAGAQAIAGEDEVPPVEEQIAQPLPPNIV